MRKSVLIALFLAIIPLFLHAQAHVEWYNVFGDYGYQYVYSIIPAPDSGYFITSNLDAPYVSDCLLARLDDTGGVVWEKSYGGSANDGSPVIIKTTDNTYLMASSTKSNDGDVSGNHGDRDVWLVKLNDTGGILWQKCYGGTGLDAVNRVISTSDGGFAFSGSTTSNDGDVSGNHGGTDFWIVKLDSAGAIMWQKCLGGTGSDSAVGIKQTSDGGYIVVGTTKSQDGDVSMNHGNYDVWVVKMDATGNIEWEHAYGGSFNDFGIDILETPEHSFIIAGNSNSNDGDVCGNTGNKIWVFRVDQNGVPEWTACYGDLVNYDNNLAAKIIQATNGAYVLVGRMEAWSQYIVETAVAYVVKMDALGNEIWHQSFAYYVNSRFNDVIQTGASEFVFAGGSGDIYFGRSKCYILKLGGVPVGLTEVPAKGSVVITPNPSDGHFTITLPVTTTKAELSIVNMLGEAVLQKELKDAKAEISIADIPGIYFVKLRAGAELYSSKLIIQ